MEKNDNVRMSEDFFRLLRRSSARCGGAALFGEELSAAAPAVRQSFLPHSAKSHYYFEFPLIGHPCLDIMIQYKCGKLLRDMQLVENDVLAMGILSRLVPRGRNGEIIFVFSPLICQGVSRNRTFT